MALANVRVTALSRSMTLNLATPVVHIPYRMHHDFHDEVNINLERHLLKMKKAGDVSIELLEGEDLDVSLKARAKAKEFEAIHKDRKLKQQKAMSDRAKAARTQTSVVGPASKKVAKKAAKKASKKVVKKTTPAPSGT